MASVVCGMRRLNVSQRLSSHIEGIVQLKNLTNRYVNDYTARSTVMGRQTAIGARIGL